MMRLRDLLPKGLSGRIKTNDDSSIVPPKEKQKLLAIITTLDALTDDERTEIFAEYCTHCGSTDSSCQCWNDE